MSEIETLVRGSRCPLPRSVAPAAGEVSAAGAGIVLAAVIGVFAPDVSAQPPAVGGSLEQRRPAERLRDLPLPREESPVQPELLPPVPPSHGRSPGLAGELEVPLAGVQLQGSTRLTRARPGTRPEPPAPDMRRRRSFPG